MSGPGSASALFDPELVGDHPAMDLLNTIIRAESGLVDVWQSDDDVLRWLVRAGTLRPNVPLHLRRGALLASARELRGMVRPLMVARKANKRLEIGPLNQFLGMGRSHCELARAKSGSLVAARQYDLTTPQGVLAPLAEAAAEFVVTADFSLVRRCEGVDCVLWFYDRTKAHRRRWCSMEVCGNRNKVARFRSKQ